MTPPGPLSPSESVSTEASSGPSPGSVPGRPKRSPVWDYFCYDWTQEKSICQVELPATETLCGKSISGKNTTNLKQHLKAMHPNVFLEVSKREDIMKKQKLEKEKIKREASLKHFQQSTLKESFSEQSMYPKDSNHYKMITRKLAIFVGSSSVANRLVENLEFKDLLRALNPRYRVPGRACLHKELDQVFIELKAKITSHLQSANMISLCCDIWSKKGLTSSYLGVTAHFFSRIDRRRHGVTIAVRRLTSAHTAATIRESVDEIMAEWDIDLSKISAVLTDNGSNMLAAFKKTIHDDEGDDDEVEELAEPTILDEEQEFLDCEEDHELEFSTHNRISCFSHTLQLVVSKFDEVNRFKELLKHAHSIVRKMNSSTKATERLVNLCGKKLVKDCPTRWSSTFLMLSRLIEVKDQLKIVLNELGWDDLATSEWRMLNNIVNLLQPFAKFTLLLSGEDFTTLSCVIPAIMDMNIDLEEMKKSDDLSEVADILQSELQRRFVKYTAPGIDGHNPLMLAATAVDVRYRLLLNPVQLERAKKLLMQQLVKNGSKSPSQCDSPLQSGGVGAADETDECEGPPPEKRFKHLGKVLEEKVKEGLEKTSHLPPGKAEIEQYFSSVHSVAESVDPITFWLENETKYPLLSSLAIDVLCIPASSAPVERTFSTAGESTSGRRNRLSDKNLEREVLIRKNRHYL